LHGTSSWTVGSCTGRVSERTDPSEKGHTALARAVRGNSATVAFEEGR
jgi:hypothetical protein